MNKIILSLSMIAFVAAIAIVGTTAYFSDVEKSTGNTFTAGTLDLKLDVNNVANGTFNLTDIKPGQELDPVIFAFTNTGSTEGWVNLKLAFSEADNTTYDNDYTNFEFWAGNNERPAWEMSADDFAKLVYLKKVIHHDSVGVVPDGPWDVTADWLAYDSVHGNNDGKLSLYELKQMTDAMNPPDCIFTLTTKTISLEMTFELGDAFDCSGTWPTCSDDYDIVSGAWNVPQADGVQVDITATLDQRTQW